MGTRGRSGELDIDVQAFVFVATFLGRVAGAVDLTIARVGLRGRNVVGAPAVGVLDDGEGIRAQAVAVVGAFAVGLPLPEV